MNNQSWICAIALSISACGQVRPDADSPEALEGALTEESAPEESVCAKVRSCGLMSDSEYDKKDCTTCARWLVRYFDSVDYDWRSMMSYIDVATCQAVKGYGEEYKFFICVDGQRNAWSRTHPATDAATVAPSSDPSTEP